MRKIILNVAVSLDGFIEGPNGEYDWCLTDQDYGMSELLKRTDAIFFGRKSYELFMNMSSDMWPDKKRYVFSNTLRNGNEAVIWVNGDVEVKIKEIKEQPGKDI